MQTFCLWSENNLKPSHLWGNISSCHHRSHAQISCHVLRLLFVAVAPCASHCTSTGTEQVEISLPGELSPSELCGADLRSCTTPSLCAEARIYFQICNIWGLGTGRCFSVLWGGSSTVVTAYLFEVGMSLSDNHWKKTKVCILWILVLVED